MTYTPGKVDNPLGSAIGVTSNGYPNVITPAGNWIQLQNNFANFPKLSYYIDRFGFVHITGGVIWQQGVTFQGQQVFTMPGGARPLASTECLQPAQDASASLFMFARLEMGTNGVVVVGSVGGALPGNFANSILWVDNWHYPIH